MKQALLVVALFGFANCGRLEGLEAKYLPANQQGYSGNQQVHSSSQQSYTGSQPSYSGKQEAAYSGSQQSYSGNQHSAASGQYNGPINRAANDVPILRLDNDNDGETYRYAVETGNGIAAQEEGDARGEGTIARGGFSYTAPDGQEIRVEYSADENGFLAQGSHLPVAPPVPEEILKAVEQNLADEARGVFDDGQYREDGAGQYRDDGAGQYTHEGAGDFKVAGKYNAGATGQYNAGPVQNYNAGSNKQYNAGPAHQTSQDGYKY